jgi:hypothetical protein
MFKRNLPTLFVSLWAALLASAADPPDVLTLADGEKLTGTLVRSIGGSVTLHSDAAGNVTIPWSKIKEFSSSRRFAVIPKGVQLKSGQTDGEIPRGVIAVTDQKIQLTPGAGQPVQTIAVNDAGFVIDEPAYEAAFHNPGFVEDWKGTLTGGVSLVKATQSPRRSRAWCTLTARFQRRIGCRRAIARWRISRCPTGRCTNPTPQR